MTTPDNLDAISNLGIQSATLATLIYFGRRFVAQHESLLRRIDDVIADSSATRTAMDEARIAFVTRPRVPTPPRKFSKARSRVKAIAMTATLASLTVAGCSIDSTYRDADRATFDAIAPAHRRYVANDESLTDDERELLYLVLDTWAMRIETAETGK